MKDRRSVDDLTINELERVLAEKKRIAREARLSRYRQTGRAVLLPVGATPDDRLDDPRPPRAPRSRVRGLFDYFLLLVEVGAVLGLIYVLYNGSNILSQLNREVSAAGERAICVGRHLVTHLEARRIDDTRRVAKRKCDLELNDTGVE